MGEFIFDDEVKRRKQKELKDNIKSYYKREKEKEIHDEAVRNMKNLDAEERKRKTKKALIIGSIAVGTYVGYKALKSNRKSSLRLKSKGLKL